ncbi:carcinoembryonic antigen-related cell adhesion molecule 8-like [Eleutherodactylus coqui]|uniref:carcinoembryonic antigen-related cell adhesion molecule 8-like n=1 Tax=Eleutherodactylus coqui TaxID=57060 RepID=UPI00346358F2
MRGFIIAVLLGLAVDVTSGQGSIQLIPQYPVINGAVILRVTGITEEIVNFIWFKGPNRNSQYAILTYISGSSNPTITGPQYNPRITAFSNGSLRIKDLQIRDGGNYTVMIQTVMAAHNIFVYLTVYEPVTKPKITGSTTQPKENDTVTLTCDTSKATTIRWIRRSAGISSEAKLSGDNKTLTIIVKRGDSGEYRCEAENLVSKESSDPYRVSVAYGPDKARIQGELLVGLGSPITLTCSADSEPDPEYQWGFNGKVLEQKIYKYSISNATTENQGLYTCVVKNTVTLRNATVSVYVNVSADIISQDNGSSPKIIGIIVAIVLLLILIAATIYLFIMHKRRKSPSHTNSNVKGSSKNESLETRQKDIPLYENVQVPRIKEESSYMDLQFRSEDTYTELRR